MINPKPTQIDQTSQLVALFRQHQIFHRYLDKLVLNHEDFSTIDLLIAVRKMNLDILNRYSDLISKKQITSSRPKELLGHLTRFQMADMTLWNIHAQLSRLVPHYIQAIRDQGLNQVTRTIVSHNYDQIIKMKEDLLHPVEQKIELA